MQTLDTGLPPGIDLDENYVIQFTALDPTTGAVVAGVKVSSASLLVDNIVGGDLSGGFEETAPLWLDLPNNLFDSTDAG